MPAFERRHAQSSGRRCAHRRRPLRQRMRSCLRAPAEHAIAEGQEAISRVERVRVRAPPALVSDERREQDEQRRARLVEIRQQAVHGAKAMARTDEQARRAGTGAQLSRPRLRAGLEHADDGRADGDDAATGGAGPLDRSAPFRAAACIAPRASDGPRRDRRGSERTSPRPTSRRSVVQPDARGPQALDHRCRVKCSPAVGAAAESGSPVAYVVWYRSGSRNSRMDVGRQRRDADRSIAASASAASNVDDPPAAVHWRDADHGRAEGRTGDAH